MATKRQKLLELNREKQRRYLERMKRAGYVKVAVWVPSADVPKVKKYVDRVRATYEKTLT